MQCALERCLDFARHHGLLRRRRRGNGSGSTVRPTDRPDSGPGGGAALAEVRALDARGGALGRTALSGHPSGRRQCAPLRQPLWPTASSGCSFPTRRAPLGDFCAPLSDKQWPGLVPPLPHSRGHFFFSSPPPPSSSPQQAAPLSLPPISAGYSLCGRRPQMHSQWRAIQRQRHTLPPPPPLLWMERSHTSGSVASSFSTLCPPPRANLRTSQPLLVWPRTWLPVLPPAPPAFATVYV